MSISISAPSDLVEKLETLLKSHSYTLMADYAASELPNLESAAVFNLSKRQ